MSYFSTDMYLHFLHLVINHLQGIAGFPALLLINDGHHDRPAAAQLTGTDIGCNREVTRDQVTQEDPVSPCLLVLTSQEIDTLDRGDEWGFIEMDFLVFTGLT